MNAVLSAVRAAVRPFGEVTVSDGGVVVPTMTIMPGGDVISIVVAACGGGRYRVSDHGAARGAVLDAGLMRVTAHDRSRARELAEEAGLALDGDAFVASDVAPNQILAAVAYVADVSRAWATDVIDRTRRIKDQEIAERVGERLDRLFTPGKVVREATVLGASNSPHRFDFLVDLGADVSAVIDIVTPVQQSIAFAHMKFSDVRRGREDWPREAVVQKVEEWSAESLSLLGQVVTHIRDASSDWRDLAPATGFDR